MDDIKPSVHAAYQELADAYSALGETKPHNAYYDRPAVFSLLPADLRDKKIFDAGCGPGLYAKELADKGAVVTGVDLSENMIEHAKDRSIARATFYVHDLTKPLTREKPDVYDMVISPLVLNYIPDLQAMFKELYRILKSQGFLVFSMQHPFFDYQYYQSLNYFHTENVECVWKGFGKHVTMPCLRRPLQDIINSLLESGFTLDKVLEPLPTKEFKKAAPSDYGSLIKFPSFICFRAIKL
jgi:SAM-dependent methyltransferase